MSARVGVVVFPGTNCETDVAVALGSCGARAEMLWHGDATVRGVDAVVIPGGFAHGDYLRTGAIARFSPVLDAIASFVDEGGPVVGICNGFQVLCEAGLLPGALRRNVGLRFLCTTVGVEITDTTSPLTRGLEIGQRMRLPINHFEGCYTIDHVSYRRLDAAGQVVARYVDNPNGSVGDVAAVRNERGNVVGIMPHPERAADPLTGLTDGTALLSSLIGWVAGATQPI